MNIIHLHIGLPKTGTSYLQGWLHVNQALLAKSGVWAPAKTEYAHRLAAEYITDPRRAVRPDVKKILLSSLSEAVADFERGLTDPRFRAGVMSSEYFYECSPQSLSPIIKMCGKARVVVVLYLRRQDRQIEAGFNQQVKTTGQFKMLPTPVYQERYDWLKLFQNWTSVFGAKNVIVRDYDSVAKAGSLLENFCHVVGFPAGIVGESITELDHVRNVSLPANLLEFKRVANVLGQFGLDKFLFEAASAGVPGRPFRLSPEVARQHLSFYAEGNKELSRLVPTNRKTGLFAEFNEAAPPVGEDLTGRLPVETVAQLLALVILQSEQRHQALTDKIKELEQKIESARA